MNAQTPPPPLKLLPTVTGYVGAVSGFNEGKKQELRDRKRYDIGGR